MSSQTQVASLNREIREIYRSDRVNARNLIERHLEERLKDLSPPERVDLVEKLTHRLRAGISHPGTESPIDADALSRLFFLLLGKEIKEADCPPEELVRRLARSLNTIFDSLNELVAGINATLMGRTSDQETIRFMIGSHLKDVGEVKPLESYVQQIKEAFAVAHQAFKDAARTKMKEILNELNPSSIEKAAEGGLKFGPLRKAEMFDVYKEKFRTLENWLESGLLLEALMREFERICQRLYSEKRRMS